jgi:hypothetical protein
MAEQGTLPPELHEVRKTIEEHAERAEAQPALEGSAG